MKGLANPRSIAPAFPKLKYDSNVCKSDEAITQSYSFGTYMTVFNEFPCLEPRHDTSFASVINGTVFCVEITELSHVPENDLVYV